MRIELTIKTDYLPTWGVWEGIRELVQNGLDEDTDGHKLTVRWRAPDVLVIENEGSVLPHEALLLGHSSKAGRSDMIGKFGEGLKLGVLALVRQNVKVKIRSGSEVWVPEIGRSKSFNADVLAFDIASGRKDEQRVQVEVSGVDKETWHRIRAKFLALEPPTKIAETSQGSILLDPDRVGQIFVKGVFVQHSKYAYGYDLSAGEVDRDRRMISSFDLGWQVCRLWREAVGRDPKMLDRLLPLLESSAPDVEGVDDYLARDMSPQALLAIAAAFRSKHGDNALPVSTLSESADIEHLGMQGVIVGKGMRALLEKSLGTLENNRASLREQPCKHYSWRDLAESEKNNLRASLALVCEHAQVSLDLIDVCDFREPKFLGFFRDGRILLAKRILGDESLTLEVLVHETAHMLGGGDGEKSHVANIEKLWSGIVAGLRAKK